MVGFECNRCHRIFKRKDYLQKHMERKFPCKVAEIKENITGKKDNVIQTLSKPYPNNIQKNKVFPSEKNKKKKDTLGRILWVRKKRRKSN